MKDVCKYVEKSTKTGESLVRKCSSRRKEAPYYFAAITCDKNGASLRRLLQPN
jgi:hypothetical protein